MARTIEFAGKRWEVRSSEGPPGNRCWSDSEDSVWVDRDGALHLRIRKIDGAWCQAEVRMADHVGPSLHRFYVVSRVDHLDPSVVLGLFLYDEDAEIDIEMSGSFRTENRRGLFTVYGPKAKKVAQEIFPVRLAGTYTTHEMGWRSDRIDLKSWHGHSATPRPSMLIHEWSYAGDGRPAKGMKLQPRINFWINGPTLSEVQEVVIANHEMIGTMNDER